MKINLELIKVKRKEKNLNIDEMASKLGLTNGSMYYKREAGQYKFKPEELPVLANVLNLTFEDLFLSKKYSKIEIQSKTNKEVI